MSNFWIKLRNAILPRTQKDDPIKPALPIISLKGDSQSANYRDVVNHYIEYLSIPTSESDMDYRRFKPVGFDYNNIMIYRDVDNNDYLSLQSILDKKAIAHNLFMELVKQYCETWNIRECDFLEKVWGTVALPEKTDADKKQILYKNALDAYKCFLEWKTVRRLLEHAYPSCDSDDISSIEDPKLYNLLYTFKSQKASIIESIIMDNNSNRADGYINAYCMITGDKKQDILNQIKADIDKTPDKG